MSQFGSLLWVLFLILCTVVLVPMLATWTSFPNPAAERGILRPQWATLISDDPPTVAILLRGDYMVVPLLGPPCPYAAVGKRLRVSISAQEEVNATALCGDFGLRRPH
jgi:hypothetical protein